MIFVTLGTQDKDFSRLLKAIDKAIDKNEITDEVIVQAGSTKYQSNHMKIFDLIPMDEFEKLMKSCDLLITHGGVGSILTGLKYHKKVLAVPRLKKYGEHENDHQKQIVEEFSNKGYIMAVPNLDNLGKTIKKAEHFHPKTYQSNRNHMVKLIENYIEKVETKSMKEKMVDLIKKNREIISYLIFGVLTTLINLIVYYALVYTILNPDHAIELQIANVVAWISSVLFAYVTNRKYVFASKNQNKVREITSFFIARLITLFMDMAIMFVGVTTLKWNDKMMKLISQVVVIVSNYIFSKLFVFKKKSV